eukprot:CAMPEP_0172441176 /NCGR_PEP_ID=MMETSP1065-20121228/1750_1 /TAXON_ID=265537 /ORGANISM="Amphiprora paludosa, Strain CCMP125" /LENGTH=145 /DNA_ID=CAMNT_0013190411 /DNA_START=223 /DNA_END=660 /DNA_ORIENTATION=+
MKIIVAFLIQVLAFVLPTAVWAGGKKGGTGADGYFEGYWVGIDPTDGGDTRRSIVQTGPDTYDVVARDSVLTLCGGQVAGFLTGVGTVDDEGKLRLQAPLTCPDGSEFQVVFIVTPFKRNLMVERAETVGGGFIYDAYFWRQVSS